MPARLSLVGAEGRKAAKTSSRAQQPNTKMKSQVSARQWPELYKQDKSGVASGHV